MTDITPEALEALSKKATPGTWEVDSEYDNDALYSGGGGCGSGFKNYFIGADVGGTWKTLLDTVNSDHKLIEEDYDEGGKEAWDVIGRANAAFIVALVNAYRTGQLVPAMPSGDVVEAVARALYEEDDPWCKAWPWPNLQPDQGSPDAYRRLATAAITAYEAASGVAKMREAVAVPRGVIAFLKGRAPLKGVWFGERHPTEPGAYWWRKYLPNPEASGEKP